MDKPYFTYQDIVNAVEKLNSYAAKPPYKFILHVPDGDGYYVEGKTAEECFRKAIKAWEEWVKKHEQNKQLH